MTTLAIFVGAIVGIVTFLFVAVHVYAYSVIWISTRKLRVELRQRHRTLSRNEAKQRIARKEGILLVDAPTLGWNVSRVWWSPRTDFIPGREKSVKDEVVSKEDVENYGRFIDVSTGAASLVDGFVITQRLKANLKRHFGVDDCAFIYTGGVLFDQQLRNRNGNG
jgi:hypothetical protein